jgi:hypothetical protein
MQAALEAAKHIGDAETPSNILREYQGWLKQEMELLAEDGKAYQQQVLRTGAHLSGRAEAPQTGRASDRLTPPCHKSGPPPRVAPGSSPISIETS